MVFIPKYMHFIWFQGRDNIPDKYYDNIKSFITHNSSWDIKIWDKYSIEEECKKYSEQCYTVWNNLPTMMMKIELARYVILYNNGGISIDMDMQCIQSIDTITNIYTDECIISEMNLSPSLCRLLSLGLYSYLVNNATIICTKNNIFIYHLIHTIINKNTYIYKLKYLLLPLTISTVNITGSVILTKLYFKYKNMVTVIPKEYVEMNYIVSKSVIIHYHELTWTKKWERYIRDLFG